MRVEVRARDVAANYSSATAEKLVVFVRAEASCLRDTLKRTFTRENLTEQGNLQRPRLKGVLLVKLRKVFFQFLRRVTTLLTPESSRHEFCREVRKVSHVLTFYAKV